MKFGEISISKTKSELIWRITIYFIATSGAVVILMPLYWLLATSFKTVDNIFAVPPQWIPIPLTFSNYKEALQMTPFLLYCKNTTIIAGLNIAGTVLSTSLISYGFSRLRFPGRNILFLCVLVTLMVPYQVIMIPQYILFHTFGWIDTFKPLYIPSFLGCGDRVFGGAFFIFLLRQYYMTIPLEMDEAAKIDGCGFWRIYYRMIIPLSKPALGIIAIFSFMNNWSDFLGPLIFLNSQKKWTIALGLSSFQDVYATEWQWLTPAAVLTLLPPLILFFFTQRYFIQGITITGVKG